MVIAVAHGNVRNIGEAKLDNGKTIFLEKLTIYAMFKYWFTGLDLTYMLVECMKVLQ